MIIVIICYFFLFPKATEKFRDRHQISLLISSELKQIK